VVRAADFTTFDVKLDQLLSTKRLLAEDMLNGAGDVSPGDFNIADVVPPGDADGIDERVTLDMALRMEWRYFEGLASVLWAKQGYSISYCTAGSNDNGVDVVAIEGDRGVLIQTKSSGIDGTKLGWDTVKDVVAGEAFYRRKHPGIKFERVGLTNQFWNGQAQEQAGLNNVELVDQMGLELLLNTHSVTMSEVERALHADWSDSE
jgi:Holliday junction resolvase